MNDQPKTVSDVMPEGEGLDLPERKFGKDEIEGEQVFLLDALFATGKYGDYVAVIMNRDTEGEGFCFFSSDLIMEKMKALKDEGHLPILGTFRKQPKKNNPEQSYWNLV